VAVVVLAMVLHAMLTLAPIALIDPLMQSLGKQNQGKEHQIPSDEIVVTLRGGEKKLLSEILESAQDKALGWKERLPVIPDLFKWVKRHPLLRSLFLGSKSDAPLVRINQNQIEILPDWLEVFTTDSLWSKGHWNPLGKARPEVAAEIVSAHRRPKHVYTAPLLLYALLVPFLYLIKGLVGVVRQVLLASVALGLIRDIQNDLYSKILIQPVGFF